MIDSKLPVGHCVRMIDIPWSHHNGREGMLTEYIPERVETWEEECDECDGCFLGNACLYPEMRSDEYDAMCLVTFLGQLSPNRFSAEYVEAVAHD